MSTPASAALLLAVALVLPACKQHEGDRCEIDSDCSGDLFCDNPLGTGGQCRARNQPAPSSDAATTPPLDPDASSDLPGPDAAPSDARPPDAAADARAG